MTVSLVFFFLFLRMSVCKTNQKPCMTVVSLEHSRWRDTVEISKCCNVLGEQRIMDLFKHVRKKLRNKLLASFCSCSSVEANKLRIKLAFCLSLWVIWNQNPRKRFVVCLESKQVVTGGQFKRLNTLIFNKISIQETLKKTLN